MRKLILSTMCVISLAGSLSAEDAKAPPSARIFFTADLGCLHCDYGIGDGCAACLKLDAKTPLALAGKAAKQLENDVLDNKVVALEGVLTRDQDKRLVLTSDKAVFVAPKEPGFAAKGSVRISGTPVCGSCDLKLCAECTLAVANGAVPIILDGPLATRHRAEDGKHVTTFGQLSIDKRGLMRLLATKVEFQPNAP